MDKETQILIDALTTGLERCEGTITRLFVLLGRAGLADDFVTDAVHERQQASLKLALSARQRHTSGDCAYGEALCSSRKRKAPNPGLFR